MAQNCPTDCLREIFKHVTRWPAKDRRSMITYECSLLLDQKDYASFALVCRAWVHPAREALYYEINTEYFTHIAVEKLAETLVQDSASDKPLARLIKHLYLFVDQYTEDAVKLILSQTEDVLTYCVQLNTGITNRISGELLPTRLHSRLRRFQLWALSDDLLESGGTSRRCEAKVMEQLPETLELLHLFGVDFGSITATNLPALQNLTIEPAAGFKSTIFKKTPPVTTLSVGELNVRELGEIFASIGITCEELCITSLSTNLEGYDFPTIPSSVRRLELERVDLDFAYLPSALESLEWDGMKTSTYTTIMDRLCDPEFLPCLKHFPVLTFSTGRNVHHNDAAEEAENGGEGDVDFHDLQDNFGQLYPVLDAVDLIFTVPHPQRAYAALERRGLPRPSVDEETDKYGVFHILESYFRAMHEE